MPYPNAKAVLVLAIKEMLFYIVLAVFIGLIIYCYTLLSQEADKSPCQTGEGIIAGMPCREEDQ